MLFTVFITQRLYQRLISTQINLLRFKDIYSFGFQLRKQARQREERIYTLALTFSDIAFDFIKVDMQTLTIKFFHKYSAQKTVSGK